MKRMQYVNGIVLILWGLIFIIPVSQNLNASETTFIIPLIVMFILTGIGIINNNRLAWTFALALGLFILIHFVLSVVHEIFRHTDIRRGMESVMLFSVWSTLVLVTSYSTLGISRKDIRVKLGIPRVQVIVTLAICLATGILWSLFLSSKFYWL